MFFPIAMPQREITSGHVLNRFAHICESIISFSFSPCLSIRVCACTCDRELLKVYMGPWGKVFMSEIQTCQRCKHMPVIRHESQSPAARDELSLQLVIFPSTFFLNLESKNFLFLSVVINPNHSILFIKSNEIHSVAVCVCVFVFVWKFH